MKKRLIVGILGAAIMGTMVLDLFAAAGLHWPFDAGNCAVATHVDSIECANTGVDCNVTIPTSVWVWWYLKWVKSTTVVPGRCYNATAGSFDGGNVTTVTYLYPTGTPTTVQVHTGWEYCSCVY